VATVRLIPPVGLAATSKVNGRTYTCAAGATIDVLDFDAGSLTAQGWLASGLAVGVSAARPVNPPIGTVFNDTSVGAAVIYVGKGVWAHHANGSSV
jgi:hypothetical protein